MNTEQLVNTLHEQGKGELAQFISPNGQNTLELVFTQEASEADATDGAVSSTNNGLTVKGLVILALEAVKLDSDAGTNEQAISFLNEAIAVYNS